MASTNNQTDGINDRDPPTFVPDGGPGSPPPPGGQLAADSYRPGGPTRPSNGDWQEAGLRPDANSPGPFRPQPDDQLASGSYRPGGPTRPSNGDWQEAGLRPDANSPGPFRPQPEDQLASGSYRSGGPTKPTSGDWQEAGLRPDANSPGPFNPAQGQTLASKQFNEQDPTFVPEGGPRLPPEVQKLAESMKQSGKYEAYDREQVGNIAAAAFNSAGGKFTPTDVVQVANGQFVAVSGDPQNPASPRTDPIDPKAAAATPALQSLAQLNQPQQAQMVAQTNDIENPVHKTRSV
jgi:hypothetical protein